MTRALCAACLGLLLCTLGASFAAARSAPHEYLDQGNFSAARQALSELVADRPDRALHMAYLEGQILLRQRRVDAAAAVFRAILEDAPGYVPARRELAVILVQQGRAAEARLVAESLINQTSDRRLRDQLQALLVGISQTRPRGVAFRFSLLPSNNLNRRTAERTITVGQLPFTLDPGSRAVSGTALSLGLTAWNRWQLGGPWSAIASASLDRKFYDSILPDETTAIARVNFVRAQQGSELAFGPVAEWSFADQSRQRRRLGIEARARYSLNPASSLSGGLRWDRQEHDNADYLDGHRAIADLTWRHRFNPGLSLSVGVSAEREWTRRDHLDHTEVALSFGLGKRWRSGLMTQAYLAMSQDRYGGVFPGFDVPRRDRVASIGVTFSHRKLRVGRFTPQISYTYTRASSNIPIFDYDSADFGVGFATEF